MNGKAKKELKAGMNGKAEKELKAGMNDKKELKAGISLHNHSPFLMRNNSNWKPAWIKRPNRNYDQDM
jgi:hypothetical protein